MGMSFDANVAYGFAIGEEDTDVLELLIPLCEEGEDNPRAFGLDFSEFSKRFPSLSFSTSGYDGDEAYLLVYAEDSHRRMDEHESLAAKRITDDSRGDTQAMIELETFSETYGIYLEPTWMSWGQLM